MRQGKNTLDTSLAIVLFTWGLFTVLGSIDTRADDASEETSRSTNITFNGSGGRVFTANFEANSVSVFRVQNGGLKKVDEVPVGREPVCVAAREGKAYVTNAASGTVSVLGLKGHTFRVLTEIPVGTEPHGCALNGKGDRLMVANLTAGTVSIIDAKANVVIDTVEVGGRPMALAVKGDRVFVTQFFARAIEGGPGPGFDTGSEGVVQTFTLDDPHNVEEITLSPLADSGFTADRTKFCKVNGAVNDTFCPDPTGANTQLIQNDPQGVYPNQLASALICGDKVYLPNIGAQPEPPVQFTVNVQALVHVVDVNTLQERTDLHVNLNAQIKTEPNPANPTDLVKLFGNDLVAIDADAACQNFFLVSRGANVVLKATLINGKLDIGAPNNVVRFQTGNIPTGIAVDPNGQQAFVNNEVNLSVSVLDLAGNTVLARDIAAGTLPPLGSFAEAALKGKLVFFTALGVPNNELVGVPIRELNPLQFRGKQSNNAWSTCGSCHPGGLADGVTWIFPDGPRQSIPLDGLYAKTIGAHDTRINNWSAARDSVTDFNNNSRAVQGGIGFVDDPARVFDHGISSRASEALDVETTWTQTIRPFNMPKPDLSDLGAGAGVFNTFCASCHGGAKWTKSQVLYLNNPALDKAFAAGGTPRDPGLTMIANQSVTYADPKVDPKPLKFLEDVGTFDPTSPIEIRGAGAAIGQGALGTLGFNVPSVLSTHYHAPFFHDGSAQSLEEVFARHKINGVTIADTLSTPDEDALLVFLRALDGKTPLFESDNEIFKDPTRNLP